MKKYILIVIVSFAVVSLRAQVGIGTATPDASSKLEISSTNSGILIPRMNTSQRTAIADPAQGLLVFDTDKNSFYYYNGSSWISLSSSATGWQLSGNAGTVDGTNFIGTTDNKPLNIRVNNQRAGRIDNNLNNTFWGYLAGDANINGINNTANGHQALYANKTGTQNTAIGLRALYNNVNGHNNTAIGTQSLIFNDGSSNTATGMNALMNNSFGSYNTAYGYSALSGNESGNNNTAIGSFANVGANNLSNATVIGYGATVNASNKIRLGNNSVTVIEGQVAYSFPSDKRFKYDIKKNVPGLDFIKKLTPVTYHFDDEKLEEYSKSGVINNNLIRFAAHATKKQLHTGFLAQDVEKAAKELGYQFDGVHAPTNNKDHYSLAYSQFIMPLVKSVQEQQQIIEEQNKKIEVLQKESADAKQSFEERIKKLEMLLQKNETH